MHQSNYRLNAIIPDEPSGARSSDVKITYFDPKTGDMLAKPPKYVKANARWTTPMRRHSKKQSALNYAVVVDGRKYPSIGVAERALGMKPGRLSYALRNGKTTYKGHTIAYDGTDKHLRSRVVIVDGKEYPSITAAAKDNDISSGWLSIALLNGNDTCKGHQIAYKEG